MKVYRICLPQFADDLSGEGAYLYGGRWNFPKTRLLYTSSSASLCLLEMLVHLPDYQTDSIFTLLTLEVPEFKFLKFETKELPEGWDSFQSLEVPRKFIAAQLIKRSSLGFYVPSVVMPLDFNLLLNPLHSGHSEIKIIEKRDYKLSDRFIK